ncbi:MAG: sensor histidine kinase [Myxococcota bacterium]
MKLSPPRFGWSLRASVALLVAFVVAAPLLLVAAWLGVERRVETAMQSNAAFAAEEAVRALGTPTLPLPASTYGSNAAPSEGALERIARVHLVRIRLTDEQGVLLRDYNHDSGRDLSERAGGVVLRRGDERARSSNDEALGPLAGRDEFQTARDKGKAQGCRDSPERGIVLCYAIRKHSTPLGSFFVHAQDSAERPLPLLYELRFQLGWLTLAISPFALGLAFWAGRRLVGPFEALRDQVLRKVSEARPVPNLSARAGRESEQLAHAFNTLLERLNERRAANEAFVADLVHEFKSPVATIRACGESLTAAQPTPERAAQIARLVQDSAARLDALVSQFLELARAEAGMLREHWEPLDLAALAAARVQRAREDERWQQLRFEFHADSARVRGVAEGLETVLDNLLANAASFAKAEGVVKVRIDVNAGQVVLSVEDDGPGIAPEDLPHIFERFFTTRRHDKGTGLGLSLVRAIVEAHGGQVSASSELGRGATLRATFPALI